MINKKKHGAQHDNENPEPAPHDFVEISTPPIDAERIKDLEEALAAKGLEAANNWDKYLRERADLENYRKRVQKEKEEILKYGNEAGSAVIEGVKITFSMLLATLKKFGVTPLETPAGTPFDPAFHQAMGQVVSTDQEPNTVVNELQKGYLLNERLLRPAMVTVAIAPKAD